MPRLIAVHEVDDVDHWLASTIRDEAFASIGGSVSTFVDPTGGNVVGLVIDVPDVEQMLEMLASPVGQAAMEADGVRPDTIVLLTQP